MEMTMKPLVPSVSASFLHLWVRARRAAPAVAPARLRPLALAWLLLLPPLALAEPSFLKAKDEILTVGDSITQQGIYQEYMQRILDTLYPGAGIRIVNRGIGGMGAEGGIGVLEEYLRTGKPSIVTVMFGVNDTRWSALDPEGKEAEYIKHLTRIIEIAKANGLNLILLRETHFSHNAYPAEWETAASTWLEGLLRAQDKLAAERGVPVVNVHDAYRRALAAAWATDLHYEFTPDVIHPTQPGHAAMAVEILRALGAGLPLATDARGPLHIARDERGAGACLDAVGIIPEAAPGEKAAQLAIQVRAANFSAMPFAGVGTVVLGDQKYSSELTLPPYGADGGEVLLSSEYLKDRWGVLPIYLAFVADNGFFANHALLTFSRLVPAAREPFTVKAADFLGPGQLTCPVTDVAVRRVPDGLKVSFTWSDQKVVFAQTPFKNRFGKEITTRLDLNSHDGQLCDAVELFVDLRPDASVGRPASAIDGNAAGVLRYGIFRMAEGDATITKLQTPPDVNTDDAKLAFKGDAITLDLKFRPAGSFVGFSMRVTDTDEFKLNKGPFFVLTGDPRVTFAPLSYILLSNGQTGIFYRVGY